MVTKIELMSSIRELVKKSTWKVKERVLDKLESVKDHAY